MNVVHFCRFGKVSESLLRELPSAVLGRVPKDLIQISIESTELDPPTNSYVPNRKQYLADFFLGVLEQHVPSGDHGFALVNLDLFVSKLNFVFGVAQYGGNAIVALPRLNPAFYGGPEDPELFFQRVAKETLHELGHVFGLEHCRNYCVMRFSNSLGDTDRKPDSFCSTCFSELAK